MMPVDILCTFNVETHHRVTENVKKQTFSTLKPDEIKPYLLDKKCVPSTTLQLDSNSMNQSNSKNISYPAKKSYYQSQ